MMEIMHRCTAPVVICALIAFQRGRTTKRSTMWNNFACTFALADLMCGERPQQLRHILLHGEGYGT